MNYRIQATLIGILLIGPGAAVLSYSAVQAEAATNPVPSSVIAFVGLGLILIGALTMFAAPEPLIASKIADRIVTPSSDNLSMIVESLRTKSSGYHVPSVVLGRETQVFLVIPKDGELPTPASGGSNKLVEISWNPMQRVLEPPGLMLMIGYEKTLKRDFLGLDVPQLARLLAKAIVPEHQLCSAFSLRDISTGRVEAIWTKPTVAHTCTSEKGRRHPELCYLCSSVACALAKATGKAVKIEESASDRASSTVITTYSTVGD